MNNTVQQNGVRAQAEAPSSDTARHRNIFSRVKLALLEELDRETRGNDPYNTGSPGKAVEHWMRRSKRA